MNITELGDRVAAAHGNLNKSEAKRMVEAVFAAVLEAAKDGQEVSLPGFGKFSVQDKPARQGRNPRTGEAIEIAASRKLVFTPGKAVRDALNG